MFGKFNVAKCETTCRLALGRIKIQKNKRQIQLKQYCKDIADLLRTGKQEYARIRVEAVIREKYLLKAYEILELYLEMLTVRTQLLAKTKEIPGDMVEAISSIIYSAERVPDTPELTQLRQLFAGKYGKEYATEAGADATASKWEVNQNLIKCLLIEAPRPEEKLAMLSEIAQDNGVEWDLASAARDLLPPASAPGAPLMGGPGPAVIARGGAPLEPSLSSPTAPLPAAHSATAPAPPPQQQHQQQQHMQQPSHMPMGPQGQYANVHQAAAAAAAAAAQAQVAADYAAQFAAAMTGAAAHGAHGAPPQAPAMPPPVPQQGWLSQTSSSGGAPPGMPPAQPPAPAQQPAHPAPPPMSGGFVARSEEELQRAYDAALGPPTKGELAPPSAPAASHSNLPSPPSPPPSFGNGGDVAGAHQAPPQQQPTQPQLPPAAAAPPAPAAPPAVVDEYEELTRRLDALKRS